MDIVPLMRDFFWQFLVVLVMFVQFVTIVFLRRRVQYLESYEHWYHNVYEQPQQAAAPRVTRPFRR